MWVTPCCSPASCWAPGKAVFPLMQEGSLELELPHYIQHPLFPQHRQFSPTTQLNKDIIHSTVYMTTNTLTLLPEEKCTSGSQRLGG